MNSLARVVERVSDEELEEEPEEAEEDPDPENVDLQAARRRYAFPFQNADIDFFRTPHKYSMKREYVTLRIP